MQDGLHDLGRLALALRKDVGIDVRVVRASACPSRRCIACSAMPAPAPVVAGVRRASGKAITGTLAGSHAAVQWSVKYAG